MSRKFFSVVVIAIATLAIGTQIYTDVGHAQDAEEAKKTEVRRKPRGRLPNYYGQVGLSNEQREKIYTVQASYEKEIGELRKQIAALEEKRDSEVTAVLTPDQKKKVDELLAAAKKRAEERRKKRSSN